MERLVIFDFQALQRAELTLNRRMLRRMSQRPKREDRVDDRREDRAEAAALVEMIDDPLRGFLQCPAAKWLLVERFDHLQRNVGRFEERAPEALAARSLYGDRRTH